MAERVHGIVKSAGWEEDQDGIRAFRVVVEYPFDGPDLPLSIIWERTPVCIVTEPPQEQANG